MAIKSITRVSTTSDGAEAYGPSISPVFSPDGTKVAFWSSAYNLVSGDTNDVHDIFIKDLGTNVIKRVSTTADGTQGNDHSYSHVFSPDGSKVAFISQAYNLVPGDANGKEDIFVKDLGTGAIDLISTTADGTQGNDNIYTPVFSPDGNKVVFSSYASNLVPGDTNFAEDIFVKDLGTGAIERISTTADGTEGNSYSYAPVFSPDGRKVAFHSWASNLVPGDTNNWGDIFVKDLDSGAIERISTAADGTQGNGASLDPVFSLDGSKVAFPSGASNLVPGDTNGWYDIFVKDLATGAIERISTAADGTEANSASVSSVFSPDGSKVAFSSYASNLVPGDTNGTDDIFVVELDDEWVAPPVNRITGTPRSERLIGTEGDDVIDGLAGDDRLKGKGGDDVLLGGRGHDRLDGGDGDDILIGGKGIDTLTGDEGGDLFVIDARSRTPDKIFDFTPSEGDRLSLGPLIDSLGLRDEPDVDALLGARRIGKNIQITLDTNGDDMRGGVKAVALLLRPEITDLDLLLDQYVTTDPLAPDYGDYWA